MKQMSPFNAKQHAVALVMRPARKGSGDPMQGAFAMGVGLAMALGYATSAAVGIAVRAIRQVVPTFVPIVPDELYELAL